MNESDAFLAVADQFKLGMLMTEMQHPLTNDLSLVAKTNLPGAIELCHEVDRGALQKLKTYQDKFSELAKEIQDTLKSGHRVYLVGCGATGRLSLCLESWWRRRNPGNDQVRGLLAGGDLALIHSLEKAEDFPEFGKRHLIEANLKPNDLVVGITEGGETSYVIGAVNFASEFCDKKPFILYCNEDPILEMLASRSAAFISNKKIKNISLPVGPMTLSGSTRMQASTVLQLVIGEALLGNNIAKSCDQLILRLQDSSRSDALNKLICLESEHYKSAGFITYQCSGDLGMTILTDTTERAPTFGVNGLENIFEKTPFSLANVSIVDAQNATESFEMILGRSAHPLEWDDFNGRAGKKRLLGFDLSEKNFSRRSAQLDNHLGVSISRLQDRYEINFNQKVVSINSDFNPDSLLDLIDFKMLLNTHSTLVMGIMGRFESNVMTWVRPNNYKLIDRTIRYASMLLEEKRKSYTYEEMARVLFEIKMQTSEKESVVVKLVEKLLDKDN